MTTRAKTLWNLLSILLLALLALTVVLPANRGGLLRRFVPGIRLGLDLQGGTQVVYEAKLDDLPVADRDRALDGVREVIERRVNTFGVTEPTVQVVRGGTPRVLVELPGIRDAEAALRQIGETPQLDFREEGTPIQVKDEKETPIDVPQWTRTELTGRHLQRADLAFDQQTGQPQVSLVFNEEGKRLFEEITKRNVGKRIAIFLDGQPITAPVVQEKITRGEAVITGTFTLPESKALVTRLNAGALPVPITLVTRTTIGPSLGREALSQSLLAGILGLLLIGTIMIVLYRVLGLIAVLALGFYALLLFAVLSLLGATLTVAGIAGFLLSLGMAVDANILIFERTKESLRAGQPITAALREGFREAWPSIRDSNVSSLITAGLLYAFGSNVVLGFATTLFLGIIVSMFTAIGVTRVLLHALLLLRGAPQARWFVAGGRTSPSVGRSFSIVRTRGRWLTLSGLLVLASVLAVGVYGIRPGVDFTGGSLMELRSSVPLESVRAAFASAGEPQTSVQDTGTGTLLARLRPLTTDEHAELVAALERAHPGLEEVRFESVGPTIGRELLRKAVLAVGIAVLGILAYLSWVFRRATATVSPWAFGVVAIIALIHDLTIMVGGFSLLARFRGASADSLFLTAALTLLGFSVHDTIVVFNRIKSNLVRLRVPFPELADRSVLETLARSVNTSATTLVVLVAILLFGGATIRPFAATLSLGIFVGTYSSITVATPLLVIWQSRRVRVR